MTESATPLLPLPEGTAEREPRPLPTWASALVILLCLAGGAWLVKWYVASDIPSREPIILNTKPGNAQPRGRFAQQFQPPPPPVQTIMSTGPNQWQINLPQARMQVTKAGPTAEPKILLNYTVRDFIPADQAEAIVSARRIVRDNAVGQMLKATPEQLQKLRTLSAQLSMKASPADVDRLRGIWKEYESASNKGAAETKLLAAISEVSNNSRAPTAAAAAQAASQINATLTAEQWQKFRSMGNN